MVDYFKLLESKNAFMEQFWTTLKWAAAMLIFIPLTLVYLIHLRSYLRIAEENVLVDNNAALSVQRVYRGTISRERIAKKR